MNTEKLKRRLIRLNKIIASLEKEHVGNELKFTYWGGYDLGYLRGKVSEIENTLDELLETDIMLPLSDAMKFIDWVSDKSYKRCINGEWIQLGTADYKTVAENTMELYNLYKNSKLC